MKSARIDPSLPVLHRNPHHRGRGMAAHTSEASSLPLSTLRRVLGALLFAVIRLPSRSRKSCSRRDAGWFFDRLAGHEAALAKVPQEGAIPNGK